jgi:fibronectin-binding autotransporter adhesin
MALVTWTSLNSGNWSSGPDWSTGASPLQGDDVVINPAASITVTYSTGTLSINSLTTGSTSIFDFTAGMLTVVNGYSFGDELAISGGQMRLCSGNHGALLSSIDQSGGTLSLVYNAEAQGGSLVQSAGTISIAQGSFTDAEMSGTLSGLLTGNGEMIFAAPVASYTTVLNPGFTDTVADTVIASGTVQLNENLGDARTFSLEQGATLALDGNTLTLSGASALDGTITNGGLVTLTGHGLFNGLVLDNGVEVTLAASYNQTGNILLGPNGSGTLNVSSAGTLRITNNSEILTGAGGGVLMNEGTITKTGGSSISGTSVIYAELANGGGGTIDAAVGTIEFFGPSNGYTATLIGTYTGAGSIAFDAGNYLINNASHLTLNVDRIMLGGSASMTLTTSLTYGGSWAQTAGTLAVGSPGQAAGSLTLNGLAAFDGGLLKGTGTVLTHGAVNLGGGMDLEGNLQLNFDGGVSQTGNINLGLDADAITNASISAGENWLLKGNSDILGFNGDINNAGIFAKASGGGDSIVQSDITNTGTLEVNAGMLTLQGVGSLGGTVTGAASLDIAGAYQFASGLSLSVGEVILDSPYQTGEVQATLGGDVSYANDWAQDGGTLALNGNTLTLSGIASFETGAIDAVGLVTSAGTTTIGAGFGLEQGAQLEVTGPTTQTGNLVFTGGSTAPTLTIGKDGTYIMDPGVSIGGAGNTVVGTVTVATAGTLLAGGGGGENVIAAALVDNGAITLKYGEVSFLGPLTGTGGINLSNGATLDLENSAVVHNSITFGSGGGVLDLAYPDNYTGTIGGFASGDMVELQGFAFANGITPTISGDTVTIAESGGPSVTLTFSTAQTASQLLIGEGPHGGLALIHL